MKYKSASFDNISSLVDFLNSHDINKEDIIFCTRVTTANGYGHYELLYIDWSDELLGRFA